LRSGGGEIAELGQVLFLLLVARLQLEQARNEKQKENLAKFGNLTAA